MRVAVAGTFGPIHDGHRNLFEHALRFGDDGVIVGLTSDEFARESRSRPVPPYEARKADLESIVEDLDERGREVEIREVSDPHAIVADDPTVDALVVSPETADELVPINDERRNRGLDPLTGIVAPYVLAENGERISSTRIVRGEIDDRGRAIE
ncbi:phosphopantetheine adenylyltransferase [Halosolutus gelatinilyticus]|uniref:phosphopantetheine adenylyltransferase n=1 Tax=Halosolutus gelatinilyticus TaxID=2931975 RepID=UPI001FF2753E|nr:pantetheine-phosphate adenylyltransferase [Halosolutus gelatinilyticus]